MTVKTNERPGTRAVLRHCRMSSTKAREVLDLVVALIEATDGVHPVLNVAAPVGAR